MTREQVRIELRHLLALLSGVQRGNMARNIIGSAGRVSAALAIMLALTASTLVAQSIPGGQAPVQSTRAVNSKP